MWNERVGGLVGMEPTFPEWRIVIDELVFFFCLESSDEAYDFSFREKQVHSIALNLPEQVKFVQFSLRDKLRGWTASPSNIFLLKSKRKLRCWSTHPLSYAMGKESKATSQTQLFLGSNLPPFTPECNAWKAASLTTDSTPIPASV